MIRQKNLKNYQREKEEGKIGITIRADAEWKVREWWMSEGKITNY